MSNTARTPISNVERIVAFVAIGLAIVAFCCLVAVLAAPALGVAAGALTSSGWQTVFLVAYFGFPVAFVLMLGLIIARIVQNRRARDRR